MESITFSDWKFSTKNYKQQREERSATVFEEVEEYAFTLASLLITAHP